MFKNVLMVLGIAAATMAATLPLCWPNRVGAVGPAGSPAAGPPTLACNGLNVSARTSADACKVGEQPAITLEAVNTTDQEVSATVQVRFTSLSPGSAMSRRLELPTEMVKVDVPLTLAARQKKTVPLETDLRLTKAAVVSVYLAAGGKQIAAAGFTVKADAQNGTAVTKAQGQTPAQAQQ
jgi:hypothetical protein